MLVVVGFDVYCDFIELVCLICGYGIIMVYFVLLMFDVFFVVLVFEGL